MSYPVTPYDRLDPDTRALVDAMQASYCRVVVDTLADYRTRVRVWAPNARKPVTTTSTSGPGTAIRAAHAKWQQAVQQ